MHHDDGQGRELLWAAAMLHSCGQHINLSAYRKHSWYLIRHGELLGYSEAEHLMVAAIARVPPPQSSQETSRVLAGHHHPGAPPAGLGHGTAAASRLPLLTVVRNRSWHRCVSPRLLENFSWN